MGQESPPQEPGAFAAPPDSQSAAQEERASLLRRQFAARAEIQELQRVVDEASAPGEVESQLKRLDVLFREEHDIEGKLLELDRAAKEPGLVFSKSTTSAINRGTESARLEVKVFLELAHVPTSICHLLDAAAIPLVRVSIENKSPTSRRRVRVRSYVDGYSAEAVNTVELPAKGSDEVRQLPTFFPHKTARITELTRATLNVVIDDLEAQRIELHETRPLWLLARNSAPIKVKRPATNEFEDMRQYLGAFVTPHHPGVLEYLGTVASRHAEGRLDGYFAGQRGGSVISQVEAVYRALKENTGLRYISSFIDFNPNGDSQSQRVRLPRESLQTHSANCLDGAVLFASLLEAISLKPAIVYVPGHAMVAWQDDGVSDQWTVLDTTRMDRSDFQGSIEWGRVTRAQHDGSAQYRFLPLPELRKDYGITPLE